MYSDISDKLLHGVVFQVTVATVHLERMVADLWGENEPRRGWKRTSSTTFGYRWGLTLKHSSVAKSLAIEHRETASKRSSCSAFAASRTSRRDATNLVAISASWNWRNCKARHRDQELQRFRFGFTRSENTPVWPAWLLDSVSPNCFRTNRWSFASCTQACAAPREQDAVGWKRISWQVIK